MIRGRENVSVAVRRPNGEVRTRCEALSSFYTGWMRNVPLVRGIIVLVETLILGMKALMFSANAAMEEEGKEDEQMSGWSQALMLAIALAIAIKTYFQKIADPRDFASSAGVSFTINHVAAGLLPAALGLLWLSSPALVFLCGTGFAVCSLILSLMIPVNPAEGREFVLPAPMHSSRARFPG